jgi:hypothetical protein
MDDRLGQVELAVRSLEASLASVERRIAALERSGAAAVVASAADGSALVEPESSSPEPVLPSIGRDDLVTALTYVGRSCLALGGAYLLRAISDAELVPRPVGITLGFVYGLSWLAMADRAAARGERLNAALHALLAVSIAFPVIWEAAVRFTVVTPTGAAMALAVASGAALGVALQRHVQLLAWIATVSALAAAVALIAATGVLVPFAIYLIVLGAVTLWIGYMYDWVYVRWPVAVAANIVVLALTMRASNERLGESPLPVIGVQLLLLNAYIGSIIVRTLVRARDVNPFEVVQAAAALAIGFGGSVYLAYLTGAGVFALAIANLAAGVSCYVVAFTFLASRHALRRNFYFYTSLALVLVLVSSRMLASGPPLALVWAALALVSMTVASDRERSILSWHGAVYLAAAAAAANVWRSAGDALVGADPSLWAPFTAPGLIVMTAGAACWAVRGADRVDTLVSRLPRAFVTYFLVWTLSGGIVALATPMLDGAGAAASSDIVATIRTMTIAAAALALAWVGRLPRSREGPWLVYPVLFFGAVKLLVEDLPHSRPAMLFVALAFYGGVLIAAPRMAHRPARKAHPANA